MKQVIWVAGRSSSGKQTFIRNLQTDTSLRQRFSLPSGAIEVVKRSIDYVGDSTMLDTVVEREQILHDASQLLKNKETGTILIKWQYTDSLHTLPEKLEAGLFNAQHRFFILETDRHEVVRRLEQKDWWRQKGFASADELYDYETKIATKLFAILEKDFDTVHITSTTTDY